jgi:PAS domain S-box-containing protein
MRFTFRTKLLTLVGVAAAAFVLLIIASALIAERVERQLAVIQDRYLPKVVLQPQLEGAFEQLRRGFQDAVAAHDPEALAATRPLKSHFLAQLDAARDAVDAEDGAALRAALEDYDSAAFEVSRRLIADEAGEAVVEAMAAMQAKQARVADALARATAFDGAKLNDAFAEATRSEAVARSYRLWISLACLASVLLLSLALSRSLLSSVAELTAGFARFGAGTFERPIRITSTDELGDLALHANQMAANLERLGQERRKAEERFRTVVESAPDAMVIVGEDGRIVLVNAQTEVLFGFARDELVGREVEVLLPERYKESPPERRTPYFRDPKERSMASELELFGRRKDGTEFPIEISSSPLETEEGLLVSSAIRDVTDRKQAEAALKLSNRELEAFSYSVAHDLRAPLRGINGLSCALLEDASDKLDDEGKNYLRRIGAAAERMGLLIDALLSLSRVSRVELQRETVNLTQLADAVVKQLQIAQPERTVSFINEDTGVSRGDPALLRALLDNLLGNAWKFTSTRPQASIKFGSEKRGDTVVYYVNDNGAGFDMAYAGKLFAPFQRLHSASDFAGTGIGLATVQRIVHRHGGEIWAEGAVDRGATFYFTLSSSTGGRPS